MINRSLALVLCVGLFAGVAVAQDPLGKGKGKGNQGGGNGGGGGVQPPRGNEPPRGNQGGGGIGKGNGGGGGGQVEPPRNQGIPDRSNGNNDQLGRINNGGGRPSGNDVLGRGNSRGRLGAPNYGGNNNVGTGNGRPNGDVRFNVPSLSKGSISSQSLRLPEARPNYGGGRGRYEQDGWRTGYWQYNQNWRDDQFWYSNYTFNPWDHRCTVSPWYLYPNLPGYITINRIIVIDSGFINWSFGNNWNRWDNWDRWDNGRNNDWNNGYNNGWGNNNDSWNDRGRDRDAYEALSDLRDAFDRQNRRALGNVVPRNGRVNIYHNGRYSYSLGADDYYDLMLDAIYSTRTLRYEITDVRESRGVLRVSARHWYQTPWGQRTSVCHTYRLESDRQGYTITDFGTGYDFYN